MGESKRRRKGFRELFEAQLSDALSVRFKNESITPQVLQSIRQATRDVLARELAKSELELSDSSVTWLANQYFKNTRVNGDKLISDMIVMNDFQLSELPSRDVELMRDAFIDTAFSDELSAELRRRSAS